jgi:protein-disulfide isomerase
VLLAVVAVAAALALRTGAPSASPLTRKALQEDPLAPTRTPAHYDVTVVVFSDYRCPYCRRLHPLLLELVRTDPHVRLVYRDWPLFGGASVLAARAAIASQWQGRHAAVDGALMRVDGELDAAAVRRAVEAAGANWARVEADVASRRDEINGLLDRTHAQATALGLRGTPGVVVGPYVIPGAVGLADLRRAVRAAREHPDGSAFDGSRAVRDQPRGSRYLASR